MYHCYKTFQILILAFLSACSVGCQQTASTARDHNAMFDFSQRPRFFGSNAAVPSPTLPQLAALNGLANPNQPATRLGGLLAGFKKPASNGGLGGTLGGGLASSKGGINTNSPQEYQQISQMANQLDQLTQRLSATDSDNQLLNTEVAGLRQKLELANQYNQTLKEQLADTSGRVRQSELEKQQAIAAAQSIRQRLQTSARTTNPATPFSQASTRSTDVAERFASSNSANGSAQAQFSSATIRANNSLMRRLSEIRIPGGEARMDGDVIRIEFPSDRMFLPGSYQIAPAQRPVLSDIVETVRRSFPRQIVGVEAHWDNTRLNPPGTTDHQLTATQSLAVFEELIRLGLPERQLFTMAMASNRPRHRSGMVGGISPNRRIELVIYPESWDGS